MRRSRRQSAERASREVQSRGSQHWFRRHGPRQGHSPGRGAFSAIRQSFEGLRVVAQSPRGQPRGTHGNRGSAVAWWLRKKDRRVGGALASHSGPRGVPYREPSNNGETRVLICMVHLGPQGCPKWLYIPDQTSISRVGRLRVLEFALILVFLGHFRPIEINPSEIRDWTFPRIGV